MAQVANNFWGVVIILEHEDVDTVVTLAKEGASLSAFIAAALPGLGTAIAGGVTAYLTAEAALISSLDNGNGVYLTTPYWAPGIFVPTSRPLEKIGLPPDWAKRSSGKFRTEDSSDLLSYDIQPNAVGSDAVEFKLTAQRADMWWKTLVLRDGEGGSWNITIDPSGGVMEAHNGLWAHQVNNGQALSLYKPKQFGLSTWVLDILHLENLTAGRRVTFTWLQS
ncbi:hypothetical protein ACFYOV_04925 [Streptomyces sp. NPDC005931]|uniref:hypothetical protein n=1 Tax=Streptomyces sp. NPDC005931 TaxID=3364737 RepID=UPI0036D19E0A